MATVPNWIADAVIREGYDWNARITETTGWRATKTQVVVSCLNIRNEPVERRFYLDTLAEVGGSKWSQKTAKLIPPDDPIIARVRIKKTLGRAASDVMSAYEKARLQDSDKAPEDLLRALLAIRDAADKALASLAEVL